MYPVPGMYKLLFLHTYNVAMYVGRSEIFNLRKSVDVEHRPAAPRV